MQLACLGVAYFGCPFSGFLFWGAFVCAVKVNATALIPTYWKFFFLNRFAHLTTHTPQKFFPQLMFAAKCNIKHLTFACTCSIVAF